MDSNISSHPKFSRKKLIFIAVKCSHCRKPVKIEINSSHCGQQNCHAYFCSKQCKVSIFFLYMFLDFPIQKLACIIFTYVFKILYSFLGLIRPDRGRKDINARCRNIRSASLFNPLCSKIPSVKLKPLFPLPL